MANNARSQVSPRTIWTVAMNLLLIAIVLGVLWQATTVVAWVLIALFVALAFEPVVRWLSKHRVRRGFGVLIVFLVAFGALGLLAATFVPLLTEQGQKLVAEGPTLLQKIEDSRPVQWADGRFKILDRVQSGLKRQSPDAAASAVGAVFGLFKGLLGAVTVTALAIFMLLFGPEVVHKSLEWIEPSQRPRYLTLLNRMRRSVGGYVAGTLVIAGIGGIVTTLGMLALGVPYYLALGLLMAFAGIIPFIGSSFGAVAVVGTTFATAGTRPAVIALVGFLIYQQLEGELLQPLVQRKTIKMNPLLITLVMLLGTALAGILGTLLALPAAGALQVVLQDVLERRQKAWARTNASAVPEDPHPPLILTPEREADGAEAH